jgi:hypothetical protein
MIPPRSKNQETDADRNGQRDGHSPRRLRNHADRSRGRDHHDHEYALRLTRSTAKCDRGPDFSGESLKYCLGSTTLKFLRAFWNPAFIVGLVILVLGCGPLIVFGILQDVGYFPRNNGLALGLLFFFTVWPALALIAVGVALGVKRVDASAGKGGAA